MRLHTNKAQEYQPVARCCHWRMGRVKPAPEYNVYLLCLGGNTAAAMRNMRIASLYQQDFLLLRDDGVRRFRDGL
jgi:hypothetical protein